MWADTENWPSLYYKGNLIAFDDVCQIFQKTEKLLIEIWKKKILQGLALSTSCKPIVDDLTNKNVGYSFLVDAKNTVFKDHTHLIHNIVKGEGNFKNFVLVREENVRWNMEALHGWLQDYLNYTSCFFCAQ